MIRAAWAIAIGALILVPSAALAVDVPAFMTVRVNSVDQGESLIIMREGDVLVMLPLLEEAGLRGFAGHRERVDGKDFVSLRSLAPSFAYELDEVNLVLKISVKAELFKETLIDLRTTKPAGLVVRGATSSFLNYSLTLADLEHFASFFEAGASMHGAFVGSTITWSTPSWIPLRGLTQLVVDYPERLERLTVGDTFVSTGLLGGGVLLGGISLSKSFDLDPYMTRSPAFSLGDAVSTPSTLELYVNDLLVRRVEVPPGPYRLANLPAVSGAGSFRYVLTDAFGRRTDLSTSYYLASGVLEEGLSDYSFGVGVPRIDQATSSFDYDASRFAVLAHYRTGITSKLTAGWRLELALGLASGGVNVAFRCPIGEIALAAAASREVSRNGWAGFFSYSYLSRKITLALSATGLSDGYANAALGTDQPRSLLNVTAAIGRPLGIRTSLSGQYAMSLAQTGQPSHRLSLSLSQRISSRLYLLASGGFSTDAVEGANLELFATMNYVLGRDLGASLSWHEQNTTPQVMAQVSKSLQQTVGYAYSVQVDADEETKHFAGQGAYQTTFGRYGFSLDASSDTPRFSLDATGAIVAFREGIFFARPISNGYALVALGANNVRTYLNNQLVGQTDADGYLLIPGLLPYYANRISFADHDLPFDRSIPMRENIAVVPYRGGTKVEFTTKRTQYYRGIVRVRRNGETLIPAYGELTLRSGEKLATSPIGAAGEVDFEDLAPGVYMALIEWEAGECSMEVKVNQSNAIFAELGDLECSAHGGVQ